MDVLSCLRELCNPTEHFEEANQTLSEMKENNPGDLLKSFGEIINWEECSNDMRRKVISIMTTVIKKTNRGFFTRESVPGEFTQFVFEIISPFFGNTDDVGKAARDTMKEFLIACQEGEITQEIFGKVISTLNEGSDDVYTYNMLDMLALSRAPCFSNPEMCSYLISFIQSRENTMEILDKAGRVALDTIQFGIYEFNESLQFVIEFFFFLLENNVPSAKFYIHSCLAPETISVFPDITQKITEIISQNNQAVSAFKDSFCFEVFSDEQAVEILGALINLFSLEENCDSLSFTIESLLIGRQNIIPVCVEYIGQHIQENGTNEKYAAVVINNIISIPGKIRRNGCGIVEEDDEEQSPINQEEIVGFILEDENPKIQRYGLVIKGRLISTQKEEITEEIVEKALQCFYSDDTDLQTGAESLLRGIFQVGNDEVILVIVQSFLETITSPSSEEEVMATQNIYSFMKNNSRLVSDEIAAHVLAGVLEYLIAVYQENKDASQVSWCIGVIGSMLENHNITSSEVLQPLTELCSTLFSDDNESDGLFLITAVCSKTKEENPEVLEFCLQFIAEHLNDPKDEKELGNILKLTNVLIDFMNPEQMEAVLSCIIGFLQSKPKFSITYMIDKTMTKLFEKCPDVFNPHAQELMECRVHSNSIDFNEYMFNVAVELEDLRGAEYYRREYSFASRFPSFGIRRKANFDIVRFVDFFAYTISKGLSKFLLPQRQYDNYLEMCPEEKKETFDACFEKLVPVELPPMEQ